MTTRNKVVIGLVAGTVVGSAIGMMIAPNTGKTTRQQLGARLSTIRQNFSHKNESNQLAARVLVGVNHAADRLR